MRYNMISYTMRLKHSELSHFQINRLIRQSLAGTPTRTAAYSIWIAYFTSYVGRIFEDGPLLIGAIGTILCLVAWGMRLMVRYKIKP